MLDIKEILNSYSLNPKNSVVVGSGILNALNLRKSNDIDITVRQKTYNRLSKLPEFKIKKTLGQIYSHQILRNRNLPTLTKSYLQLQRIV
jgi:hypothetical protein